MARRHPITVAIKQQAGEEARLTMSCARVPLGGVANKLCLNRIPQRLIDDRRVLTRMGLLLVDNLASIDPVLQHQIERAAREWLAAAQATRCARPQLAPDAAGVELVLQQPDRAATSSPHSRSGRPTTETSTRVGRAQQYFLDLARIDVAAAA